MEITNFPVIDLTATGKNILRLRRERGLSVRDVQRFFNFEEPRAIYKWQSGQSLPSLDNLYALSALLRVSMDEILVPTSRMPEQNVCRAEEEARQISIYGSLLRKRSACGVRMMINRQIRKTPLRACPRLI